MIPRPKMGSWAAWWRMCKRTSPEKRSDSFEGLQKFLYPDELGAGRFAKIGIPMPELMGPFVGAIELLCSALLLAGLATRLAALPLTVNMAVALFTTKLPILLGESFWGFQLRKLDRYGFLSMAHEARTDWAMLLGALFLLLIGPGPWSVDAMLARKRLWQVGS